MLLTDLLHGNTHMQDMQARSYDVEVVTARNIDEDRVTRISDYNHQFKYVADVKDMMTGVVQRVTRGSLPIVVIVAYDTADIRDFTVENKHAAASEACGSLGLSNMSKADANAFFGYQRAFDHGHTVNVYPPADEDWWRVGTTGSYGRVLVLSINRKNLTTMQTALEHNSGPYSAAINMAHYWFHALASETGYPGGTSYMPEGSDMSGYYNAGVACLINGL